MAFLRMLQRYHPLHRDRAGCLSTDQTGEQVSYYQACQAFEVWFCHAYKHDDFSSHGTGAVGGDPASHSSCMWLPQTALHLLVCL